MSMDALSSVIALAYLCGGIVILGLRYLIRRPRPRGNLLAA
jgi:hypothetical protein